MLKGLSIGAFVGDLVTKIGAATIGVGVLVDGTFVADRVGFSVVANGALVGGLTE